MSAIMVECIQDVDIFGSHFRAGQQYRVETTGAYQMYPAIVAEDGDTHTLTDDWTPYFRRADAQERLRIEATAWRERAAQRVGEAEQALFDAKQDLLRAVEMYEKVFAREKP